MVSYYDRYIIFHCFRIENFRLNIKIKHFYVKSMENWCGMLSKALSISEITATELSVV
jgi:hypothetical protein